MRHATESPCDKSQACLIGAGGVRGVTNPTSACSAPLGNSRVYA